VRFPAGGILDLIRPISLAITTFALLSLLTFVAGPEAQSQQQTAPPQKAQQAGAASAQQQRPQVAIDPQRAAQLYVSKDPKDHPPANYQRDMDEKAKSDGRYPELCKGIIDYQKITFRSRSIRRTGPGCFSSGFCGCMKIVRSPCRPCASGKEPPCIPALLDGIHGCMRPANTARVRRTTSNAFAGTGARKLKPGEALIRKSVAFPI
jgi:hypothetical protein